MPYSRTRWVRVDASLLSGGFSERARMLRAPSFSIWRWASNFAPLPIATMMMTARHGDDDAKCGQQAAELVQPQVFQTQAEGFV